VEKDLPERLPRLWALFGDGLADSSPEEPKIAVSDDAPHVRVVRGHFQNHEGRLIEVDDATDRVIVVLYILGSPTKVELQRADIQMK
jgi:transcription antitermination factor NusG